MIIGFKRLKRRKETKIFEMSKVKEKIKVHPRFFKTSAILFGGSLLFTATRVAINTISIDKYVESTYLRRQ